MAETREEDWNDLLSGLEKDGVGLLLKQPEVASACLAALKDAGCGPPFNHVVFFCLRKTLARMSAFGGEAVRSQLVALLKNNPLIGGPLRKLQKLNREFKEKATLKSLLAKELGSSPSAKQIAVDHATSLEVVAALHTRDALKGLDSAFQGLIGALRNDLERKLDDLAMPQLNLGWTEQASISPSVADAIRYNSPAYKFVGRGDEIETLHHFLGDLSMTGKLFNFRWLLITGPGGEGKTRLAFHFERNLPQPWIGGRLSRLDLAQILANGRWRPRQPTLLTIDYPAEDAKSVHRLLAHLANIADDLDCPVRVLLLERDAAGEWRKQILPNDGDGAAIRAHAFRASEFSGSWQLAPLRPEIVAELMAHRFAEAGLTVPSQKELIDAAVRVDKRELPESKGHFPRPLFGAAVAEIVVREMTETRATFSKVVRKLNPERILEGLLERDRHHRWKPAAAFMSESEFWQHENLLALATMCGGVAREKVAVTARTERLDFLPSHIAKSVAEAMGSTSPTERISALEPDLLGEYFVLATLKDSLAPDGLQGDFLDLALRLGEDQAAYFTLRTMLDFPERFEQRGGLSPGDSAKRESALRYAEICADGVSHLGAAGAWSRIDTMLKRLDTLRRAFPNDSEIAAREAMVNYNASNDAARHNQWKRVDAMLARLLALQHDFPGHADIAVFEAKAVVNVTGYAATGDQRRIDASLARLDALRRDYPDDAEIALHDAKAAVNIVNTAGSRLRWSLADAMLARIDALRRAFPRDVDIAREEAKAALNVTGDAAPSGNWPRAQAMMGRIAGLRRDFPEDGDIASSEAHAIYNISSGGRSQVEATQKLIERLRQSFPDHAGVAEAEGRAAVNVTDAAGAAGDWPAVDAILVRLDSLRRTFPANPDILILVAKSAMNVASYAAKASDWTRTDAMFDLLDDLRRVLPDNALIALEGAKAAVNVSAFVSSMSGRPRLNAMLARLAALRDAFPDYGEIALCQTDAAANAAAQAEAAVRTQMTGDALLERLGLGEILPYLASHKEIMNENRDAMLEAAKLQDATLRQVPDSPEAAFEHAKATVNECRTAGRSGNWPRVELLLARLELLHRTFPASADLAIAIAMAVCNATNALAGTTERAPFDAMLKRLDDVRRGFPDNAELLRLDLKTSTNALVAATNASDEPWFDAMAERMKVLEG